MIFCFPALQNPVLGLWQFVRFPLGMEMLMMSSLNFLCPRFPSTWLGPPPPPMGWRLGWSPPSGMAEVGGEVRCCLISGARGHCSVYSQLSMMGWMVALLIQAPLLIHCDMCVVYLQQFLILSAVRWEIFLSSSSSITNFSRLGKKGFLLLNIVLLCPSNTHWLEQGWLKKSVFFPIILWVCVALTNEDSG